MGQSSREPVGGSGYPGEQATQQLRPSLREEGPVPRLADVPPNTWPEALSLTHALKHCHELSLSQGICQGWLGVLPSSRSGLSWQENVSLADILSLRDRGLSEQEAWAVCRECGLAMQSVAHAAIFQSLCITPDTLAFNTSGNVCFMEQLSGEEAAGPWAEALSGCM
ncbi:hypothetical protein P7K49_024786 [Saguinus oedipus]|uniref:KIND domain-containing protein n=1 Tax=Saguinus oedipus TaxID=9490 RepID=A0ABQ9UQI0_SAGOE|nr:hypothetical protein P7K49_024786 [Saguinus oedipus]